MGQCSDTDEIDTLFGIIPQRVEGDSPTRFCLKTMVDQLDGLLRIGYGEVVKHDSVDATMFEDPPKFIEIAHFNLSSR